MVNIVLHFGLKKGEKYMREKWNSLTIEIFSIKTGLKFSKCSKNILDASIKILG